MTMAGAACKVVIDQGLAALISAIERILLDPDVHGGRIPEQDRLDLIQRLADCDLAIYSGGPVPAGGVAGILMDLEKWGVVTPEVWEIYRKPEVIP